jgi:hypothetical protein
LPFLPEIIEDFEAQYVLADADYDSKANNRAAKAIGAEPVNASNPRRGKRKKFNGHLKNNILKECWLRAKGFVKKAAMVTAGLISYDAEPSKFCCLRNQA